MKGNRTKQGNEALPTTETQLLTDKTYQFRYDFTEIEATEETPASFNYQYVNVPDINRGTIITAIIRTRYTADQEAAIVRKKQANEDILDFVKYNNFANYAKAAAYGLSLAEFKEKSVKKITLAPISITLEGGDYKALSDYCLKTGIPFETNVIEDYAIAYPSWLKPEDEAIMHADPRVEIETINLF